MKKPLLKLMVMLALGGAICQPGIARAWSVSLEWSFASNVDTIEGFLIPQPTEVLHPQLAVKFSGGFSDFDDPGWSGQVINPHYTIAQGPATNFLSGFVCSWATDATVPFEMDWYAWVGGVFGTLDEAYRFCYDGSGGIAFENESCWFEAPYPLGGDYDRFSDVPIAPTALLLASGLAGLALIGRRGVSKPGPREG
jgi:hypothetical protein